MESGVQPVLISTSDRPAIQLLAIRQRWADLGIILLVAIAPLVLNASYALLHPITKSSAATLNYHFTSGLLQEFSGVLLLFYILKRQGRGPAAIGLNFRWLDIPLGGLLAFGGLISSAIVSIFVRKLSLMLTGTAADMRDPRIIFGGAAPLLLIAYGISSSVFEETIVRGFLMTELRGLSCPAWLAMTLSVVLQGSYHLYYGVAGAFSISGVFLVFALYFAWSRRLAPVILAHLYIDLLATIFNHT